MKQKQKWLAGFAVVALVLSHMMTTHSAEAATSSCDRSCLRTLLDQYLSAVFQQDPNAAGLAPGAKTTVNNVEVKDGEGIWRTVTDYGRVRRVFTDPASGGAVYFGHLVEGELENVVSVRIKVSARKISEVEWAVARKSEADIFDADGLVADMPPPQTDLAASSRAARNEKRTDMLAAASAFFEGLQSYDSSQIPHIDGCNRTENGFRITNRFLSHPDDFLAEVAAKERGEAPPASEKIPTGDCVANFDKMVNMVGKMEPPRFPLVDEEAGVVMGVTIIQTSPNAPRQERLLVTEFFYINGGKIADIWDVVVFRL